MKTFFLLFILLTAISNDGASQSLCFLQDSSDTMWPKVFCDTIRVINGISFSPDGKTLYTSRFIERGKKDIKIYQYQWTSNKYSNPQVAVFCEGNQDYHHNLTLKI
jgi:sugar lactone lactonase YvrE